MFDGFVGAVVPPGRTRAKSGVAWDGEVDLPVAKSRTARASHNSATGAQAAAAGRVTLTHRYLQLLRERGAVSDHEANALLCHGEHLSSINSTRAQLGTRIVACDETRDEIHTWTSGGLTRRTRRTRWRLAHSEEIDQ
jgi:hypothetical protein